MQPYSYFIISNESKEKWRERDTISTYTFEDGHLTDLSVRVSRKMIAFHLFIHLSNTYMRNWIKTVVLILYCNIGIKKTRTHSWFLSYLAIAAHVCSNHGDFGVVECIVLSKVCELSTDTHQMWNQLSYCQTKSKIIAKKTHHNSECFHKLLNKVCSRWT